MVGDARSFQTLFNNWSYALFPFHPLPLSGSSIEESSSGSTFTRCHYPARQSSDLLSIYGEAMPYRACGWRIQTPSAFFFSQHFAPLQCMTVVPSIFTVNTSTRLARDLVEAA